MKPFASNLERIRGEGAFEVLARATEMERKGINIIHFEIGEPDFESAPNVVEAAKRALDEGFTHYVPSAGLIELREAVQEHIAETRGFTPDLEQILIAPGAKPVIFYTILALVSQGDEVILQDPGFPTYSSMVNYVGAKAVPVPLLEENAFRMVPEEISARITNKTKLIIINSPQNPTGAVLTESDIKGIGELAEEHDIYVLSDEIYSKLTYDAKHYSVAVHDNAAERTILLDGFSKSYAMTGWRLGYCVAPKKLIEKMTLLLINSVSCTNAFVQKAGVAALRGPQDLVNTMVEKFRKRRDAIVSGLNRLSGFKCLEPQGAFYVFPNIKGTGMGSKELADFLLDKAGVAVLPGSAFGTHGEGYLRFSYATSLDNIAEALLRIEEVV